ncbi:MAG TPA: insulinase family protein [Bacteroidales bacterium]|nr:insulinase family protein [Bacteroidales bacterium]
MKKLIVFLSVLLITSASVLQAQKVYPYDSVPGDPAKARIYTLSNGLKVYLSVYKDAPRIQTAIAVRTGSKNDPHENTGLSHYLEHLMFKGTEEFGTKDYAKEKPYLDQIENEFEVYRQTTDTLQRRIIYHVIDSLSQIASQYAIANEYDKLLSLIGGKGTNAFTSFEETVFVNDIPSNKTHQWLDIEYDRFKDPVFRLFHTELEAVYEEKNISLDNDDEKVFEALFANLFKKNTYGTQTTIGTIEHLKNPSLKSIKQYYHDRYVPNNMAIVMSGDFDPDRMIRQIDSTFGQLPSRPVTAYVPAMEDPIRSVVNVDVVGPDAESVTIGYRLPGANTPEADLLPVFNKILYNKTAGLIDLNLNQAQQVLEANAQDWELKDYSVEMLSGKPKEGQTLGYVSRLLLAQIDSVKEGKFPDWLLPAVINDIKLNEIRSNGSNQGRVFSMVDEYIRDIPRKEDVTYTERMSKLKKQDIIDFANKYFTKNFVMVNKLTGTDTTVKKVVKPQITPLKVDRESESAFLKKIVAEPTRDIEPVFIDYTKDIQKFKVNTNIDLVYTNNQENKLFSLYYYFRMGTNNLKQVGLALDYLQYLGTSKFTPSQVQQEFYKLGCSFDVSSSESEVWVSLTGLSENMNKGINLFEELLADAQVQVPAWGNMVSDIGKKRSDAKLSKSDILWSAMYNYGIYGGTSPFTNIYPLDTMKKMDPQGLVNLIHVLTSYRHMILYYGPDKATSVVSVLNKEHKVPQVLKLLPPARVFEQPATLTSGVYTVNYDMKQAEIVMLSRGDTYKPEMVPVIRLFNEYFGGGMNNIVFQEIREAKGLAYSAYAGYRAPQWPMQHYYLFSYIGTQADKLPEAMSAMMGLFNNMPESDKALSAAKDAILNKIRTERITKSQVLFNYLMSERFGLNHDIRKDVYTKVPSMTFDDLKGFAGTYVKNRNFTIMVLGKSDKLDMKSLEKYGPVKALSLEEIFGY